MQKVAVIGIGSNSVRMLVAEVEEDGFRRLTRDREGTRLFAGLDGEGNLRRDSMEKTAAAVQRMALSSRKIGCEQLHIFATSASRDARNGGEFLRLLTEKTGVLPEIVSGEEEAVLSFLGAAEAAPEARSCGVIDIGGGSTELVIGNRPRISFAISCQMGAVRLFRQLPIRRREDMAAVEEAAENILREKLAFSPVPFLPECWVGTGGTFTALAALARGIHWTDRAFMHGTRLGRNQIREIGESLADMTPEERLQLEGLQPSRADIVVHGICILLACMRHLKMEEVVVSEYGNLDGFIRQRYFSPEKESSPPRPARPRA